ncbi:hypothetical protein WA588_006400 [Blastocystis sp. NMH]
MQFFNVESTLSSTQAKVFLLTVSYLLGLNTAVLVIAALVGVVCVALLYVHALYLCFGFLKTILDGLALHLLKKVVSSRSENPIAKPIASVEVAPEPVVRSSHVQEIVAETVAAVVQAETVSAPESSIEDIAVVESVPASFSEPEIIIEESTLPASVFSESEVVEELGAAELVMAQTGATELGVAPIGATELVMAQTGMAQAGATELDAMEQRLLMPENQSGESMIPDQVMDATPAIQSENITIEELAALDPAVIVESAPIAESYIAEKEELKETALLSYNVQFVHHSDMQTIHIEEHVPALTYGPAPTPISNCTESLVFMPVTLCSPLPEYNMTYVCDVMMLVEVLPMYFNSTDAPAASQGGLVPSSADPCYGPALPVTHSASLPLLTEERAESSNDSLREGCMEEAVNSSSLPKVKLSPVDKDSALPKEKKNVRPSANAKDGVEFAKRSLSSLWKRDTAASQAANSQRNGRAPIARSAAAVKKGLSKEAEEKELRSRSSSEGGSSSQPMSLSTSGQGSRSPSAERAAMKGLKGPKHPTVNAPAKKKAGASKDKKKDAQKFYKLRHKK